MTPEKTHEVARLLVRLHKEIACMKLTPTKRRKTIEAAEMGLAAVLDVIPDRADATEEMIRTRAGCLIDPRCARAT